jgi:CheY-like chemotaxis protein
MRRFKSVLIVDDDADVRESISDVLSFAGHPNIVAADGMQALAALERCETPPSFCSTP